MHHKAANVRRLAATSLSVCLDACWLLRQARTIEHRRCRVVLLKNRVLV